MTPTAISNMALSQLPAGSITSLDEQSLQARTCKLWYQQTLEELLEMGPWRFAVKREALALMPGNDREAAWLYCYARPNDLGMVLRALDSVAACSQGYDYNGAYIYSNAPDLILEYVTTADMTQNYTAMFRAGLIAMLAARVCMPVIKNEKRALNLFNAAENSVQRAQAANQNERQNTYGDYVPEVLRERMGLSLDQRALPAPASVYPNEDFPGLIDGIAGLP